MNRDETMILIVGAARGAPSREYEAALVEQSDFGNVGQALACWPVSTGRDHGLAKLRRKLKLAPHLRSKRQ
jgi:hypothetical protein